MKITFNGTAFEEIEYIINGEKLEGLLIHDEADVNGDGDMIVGNGCELPETSEDAGIILESETGLTAFHEENGVYVID